MKTPVLDKNFYPMIKALEEYDAKVKKCGKKSSEEKSKVYRLLTKKFRC